MAWRMAIAPLLLGLVRGGIIGYGWQPAAVPMAIDAEEIIAAVGKMRITRDDYLYALQRRGGGNLAQVDRLALLDELIERQTLVYQAERAALHELAEQRWARDNLLIAALRQRLLEPERLKLQIDDGAVAAWYDANPDTFIQPAQRRLALVMQRWDRTTPEQRRAAMVAELEQLRIMAQQQPQARGFGHYAIQYSDHQASRYQGGEIGWYQAGLAGQLPAAVIEAAFRLEAPGAISEVISAAEGAYLVMVMELKSAGRSPLEQVRERIRHQLMVAAAQQLEAQFKQRMREGVRIQQWPERLPPSLPPQPSAPEAPPAVR
jgi:peptidyl-prolyl cis-trans isomerase C